MPAAAAQSRPPALRLVVWGLVLVLAVVAERTGWPGRLVTGELEETFWIWAPEDVRDARPVAVYFVRDLNLEQVPPGATVELIGDPEYVLWLNGHRIGSNRFQLPAVVDRYSIEPWLRVGTNRFVAELRSPTAAGGFRFVLRDRAQATWLQSDSSWRLVRTYNPGMEFPGTPYRGEPVRLLGRGPLGRWSGAQPGPLREAFEEELAADEIRIARQFRTPADPGVWYPLSQAPHGVVDLGPAVEFDFGGVETGYLQVSVSGRPLAGLAFFSLEPFQGVPLETEALILPVEQRGIWQDVKPRRFRYALVLGLEGVRSAAVLPVRPEVVTARSAGTVSPGLFRLQPPPSRSPVDHVLRRELQYLSSWP